MREEKIQSVEGAGDLPVFPDTVRPISSFRAILRDGQDIYLHVDDVAEWLRQIGQAIKPESLAAQFTVAMCANDLSHTVRQLALDHVIKSKAGETEDPGA